MASLSEILTNPAYVNANAETKRAIFEKHAPNDTNYSGANDATKQAIRAKFGLDAPASAAPEIPAGQIPVDPRLKAPAAQAQPAPMGKRVIDVARPTVEALGSVAGGAVGTPLGPLGMVGGAGLGYGLAKGGLDLIEQGMGTQRAPSSPLEATVRGAKDVLTGASMDAGGRAAAPILASAVGKLVDLGSLGTQRAARIARDALTKDSPRGVQDAVNALRGSAGQDVNAAQATAGMNSPTWQALMDRAGSRNPAAQTALAARQDAESVRALARAAGGDTATGIRETTGQAQKNLNAITQPMKSEALARANLGKNVAADAALREANDLALLVGSGGKVDPVRFASQASGAEKALRSMGVKPLEAEPLARRISAIPKNPAFAEADLVESSANAVADALRKWSGSGGVIDAVALDAIRKNSVNVTIAKLRPNMDATAQRNAAAGVLTEIKPFIDKAIKESGGEGYEAYLKAHSEGMQKIAEKELMGDALALWKTNKDGFVRLVQGESPEVVENVLGPGKFNIATDLADKHLTVLREQAVKALRDKAVTEQASKGQEALKNLLLDDLPKWRLPSYLNVVTSSVNKGLGVLENKLGKTTMDTLSKASESPEAARKLLETLPAKERVRILNILRNPQSWSPGASAMVRGGATGAAALTDQSSKD